MRRIMRMIDFSWQERHLSNESFINETSLFILKMFQSSDFHSQSSELSDVQLVSWTDE